MPWLSIDFHPGFAPDLTSWHTEIERDGRLKQSVRICRFMPREERSEQLEAQLTPNQCADLDRLIAAVDFAGITAASSNFGMDDAEHIQISVDGLPDNTISAPLLTWNHWQKFDKSVICAALGDAVRLWQTIENLSPHRQRNKP